jgi:hypothetical protein
MYTIELNHHNLATVATINSIIANASAIFLLIFLSLSLSLYIS